METKNFSVAEILESAAADGINIFNNNYSAEDIEKISDEDVISWCKGKTWREIGQVVHFAQEHQLEQEASARRWHLDETFSELFDKINYCLEKELDKKLEEKFLAEATENIELIPWVSCERYSSGIDIDGESTPFSVGLTAYIRTVEGNYLATDAVDDLYWGNEDSDVSVQLEMNDLIFRTSEGIYFRNNSDEPFQPLENEEGWGYRILDKNAYWKDPVTEGVGLYHRGAKEESQLMLRNPLTNKFETFPHGKQLERCYGQNFVTAFFQKDGYWWRGIYKRDAERGEFLLDAEMPYEADDCMSAWQDENVVKLSYEHFDTKKSYNYVGTFGGGTKFEIIEK